MGAPNESMKGQAAWARVLVLAVAVTGLTGCGRAGSASGFSTARAQEPADPWTAGHLLEPEQLAKAVSDPRQRPVTLYVGPAVLYKRAHITGARFIGPAAEPAGLKNLQKEAQNLPKNSEVIIYCGCCPWKVCPNIRPAFKALDSMGFKRVKVLFILNNLKQNWTDKGFPIEKGE